MARRRIFIQNGQRETGGAGGMPRDTIGINVRDQVSEKGGGIWDVGRQEGGKIEKQEQFFGKTCKLQYKM
jgi:hypothetical protein